MNIFSPFDLVAHLEKAGVLKTPCIREAFMAIDRRDFVPEQMRDFAYDDTALSIGEGQTISQPYVVAFMLELLEPEPGQTVMDVGAGSGWQTALLAHIVSQNDARGKVVAFEVVLKLCEFGKANIEKYNFLKKNIVEWRCEDASVGLRGEALCDRIIAGAAISCGAKDAIECVSAAWKKQLRAGGIMVLPINHSVWRFVKKDDGLFAAEEHPGFVFVPFVRH